MDFKRVDNTLLNFDKEYFWVLSTKDEIIDSTIPFQYSVSPLAIYNKVCQKLVSNLYNRRHYKYEQLHDAKIKNLSKMR